MLRIARYLRPGQLMILGFVTVLLIGTFLLMLPVMSSSGSPLKFIDAIFTAASSVCVTGLIVLDTATDFSLAGQIVILALIQIGGLGIMSIAGVTSMLLGQGISIRDSSLIQELFEGEALVQAGRILRFVVTMAVIVEILGTGLLYLGLSGTIADPGQRLWFALFHAVSAFCNAGFSLSSTSLMPMADNGLFTWTISALLIIGGLGFIVVANVLAWLQGRRLREDQRGHRSRRRLSVQTRVILLFTIVLLVLGAVALALLEWNGALAGQSMPMKINQAFFQSATARTAGFNTMDLTTLHSPALLVLIFLMIIGAAPGSTAGGLKVTTLAVLMANLRAITGGSRHVRLFDREISELAIRRAFMVFTAYMAVGFAGVFILLISDGQALMITAFEVVSAVGTVGLSLGMTAGLTLAGKIVIILLMFMGRLGPLALAVYLIRPARERDIRYPEAVINIG
jgi:trk/ktr system potassium uptake protein